MNPIRQIVILTDHAGACRGDNSVIDLGNYDQRCQYQKRQRVQSPPVHPLEPNLVRIPAEDTLHREEREKLCDENDWPDRAPKVINLRIGVHHRGVVSGKLMAVPICRQVKSILGRYSQ